VGISATAQIFALMSIRIHDLTIPDLRDTQEALDWGAHLTEEHRKLLLAARKGLELAALNASSLQDRANFATTAQLWREAAEADPIAYPDSHLPSRSHQHA
jgi:hypothetical protein